MLFFNFRCSNRYTHANRTCPLHPDHKVHRSNDLFLQPTIGAGEDPAEVAKWLENYRRERSEKTPAKVDSSSASFSSPVLTPSPMPAMSVPSLPLNLLTTSPFNADSDDNRDDDTFASKRLKTKRGLAPQLEQENDFAGFQLMTSSTTVPTLFSSPTKSYSFQNCSSPPSRTIPAPLLPRSPLKSFDSNVATHRPVLGDITPQKNVEKAMSTQILSPIRRTPFTRRETPPASPVKTLSLKKRWLKEVDRDQKRHETVVRDDDVENLALPIRWNDGESTDSRIRRSPLAWSAASALVELAEREFSNNQPLNLSISKRQ